MGGGEEEGTGRLEGEEGSLKRVRTQGGFGQRGVSVAGLEEKGYLRWFWDGCAGSGDVLPEWAGR